MRAYNTLRELIRSAGGVLIEEHLSPEVFSSAYAIFVGRSGAKFRLVWDGKESCGFLQSQRHGAEWEDKAPIVRERMGSNFSNLPEFLATAERLVAGTEKT